MSATLPLPLAGLMRPQAYAHPVDGVELIETPISWVLLAGEFAYKLLRPVRYPFIDQRSPAHREMLCAEELRLNRRFAPELYLDVCPVLRGPDGARMGSARDRSTEERDRDGPVLEHAVRMRRFRTADELDRLLEGCRIEPYELEAFGRHLAQIHARLPAVTSSARWGCPADVQALLVRNLLECAQAAQVFGTAADVLALRGALERKLPSAAPWMAARRATGRIRECHGDLHSGNIVRIGGRLVAFDCLEYEPAFRWIDVADEIAFLTSDLKSRARPLHAQAFRAGWLAESGDYHACRLLALYEAHRALVRAKVTALSAAERDGSAGEGPEREALRSRHVRLLATAAEALDTRTPRLLLMSGLSGSGKTWLARQLSERLAAVHIRSDVERKRRAGLDALARSRSGVATGLYSPESSAVVYDDLARAAEDVLCGGYTIIVDATFLRRGHRVRFGDLAARLGVPLRLIQCEAPDVVLRARIAERARLRRDASEADLAVLDWQQGELEAVTADEEIETVRVDTTQSDALERLLRELAGAARRAPRGDRPGTTRPPGIARASSRTRSGSVL